jgi:hypothetical protein
MSAKGAIKTVRFAAPVLFLLLLLANLGGYEMFLDPSCADCQAVAFGVTFTPNPLKIAESETKESTATCVDCPGAVTWSVKTKPINDFAELVSLLPESGPSTTAKLQAPDPLGRKAQAASLAFKIPSGLPAYLKVNASVGEGAGAASREGHLVILVYSPNLTLDKGDSSLVMVNNSAVLVVRTLDSTDNVWTFTAATFLSNKSCGVIEKIDPNGPLHARIFVRQVAKPATGDTLQVKVEAVRSSDNRKKFLKVEIKLDKNFQ